MLHKEIFSDIISKAKKTAKKKNPALWSRIKSAVKSGSKGGRAGQWSARKAQLAVQRYKKSGGIWKDDGAASSNKYALGHGGEDSPPSASTTKSFTINSSSEGTALSAGRYRVKVANLCDVSDDSAVYLFRNGEDSNDKWVTVS